jgi:hypothetical protein
MVKRKVVYNECNMRHVLQKYILKTLLIAGILFTIHGLVAGALPNISKTYALAPVAQAANCASGGSADAVEHCVQTSTALENNGSCAAIAASEADTPSLDANGDIVHGADGKTVTHKQRNIISSGGLISYLCGDGTDTRSAAVVILENIATYVLGLSTYVFAVMIILGIIQTGVSGGSPSGIQAGKKRIALAVGSISLMWLARLIFDLTGITGGRFLGVDVSGTASSPGFNKDTLPLIIGALMQYLTYVGGALSVTFIIVGGIRMMTSAGNPQGVKQAGKIMAYAAISLVAIGSLNLIFLLVKLVITGSQ